MEDKHFETEMNKQMEGFTLQPSVEVWQKVELQIRKEKRRRRFIFWWLPLLFLSTGAIVYFMYPFIPNRNQTSIVDKKSNEHSVVTTEQQQEIIGQPSFKAEPGDVKTNDESKNTIAQQQLPLPVKVERKTRKPVQKLFTLSKPQPNKTAVTAINKKEEKPLVAEVKNKATDASVMIEQNQMIENKTDTALLILKEEQHQQEIKPSTKDSTATVTADPIATIKKLPVVKKQKPEWAILFRSGLSDISQFKTSSFTADRLNATPGTAAPPPAKPSAIKAGVGFAAGIQLKKTFSKRSALSTGLAYSFYSTTHQTDSVIYASAQFSNNVSVSSVNRYAASGNSNNYTSRYHFIEIPVMYHLQLNKAAQRPFQFNTGVAYNFLLGSNAFYFNQASGNYYYDRRLFNRSQWQLRTGISVGLMKKLNYPLQAGIQYQYHLSGQWKKSLDLNQHLSFTGIQLLWRLNKK